MGNCRPATDTRASSHDPFRRSRHAGRDDPARPARGQHRARPGHDRPPRRSATGRTSRPTRSRRSARCRWRPAPSASPARSSARSRSSSTPASPTTSCSPSTSSASTKTDRLMELSSRVKRLAVVADNETVVRGLSEAGVRHGRDVPLLIECDTGFGRNGVQSPEAALCARPLRHEHAAHPLRGADDLPDQGARRRPSSSTRALELFAEDGIPLPVVSGGGTPALAHPRRLPDADRAPRRHLRLQRRDDGRTPASRRWTTAPCTCAPPWSAVRPTTAPSSTPARRCSPASSTTSRISAAWSNIPSAVVANLSEEHGMHRPLALGRRSRRSAR